MSQSTQSGVHAEAVGEQVFVSVGVGGLSLIATRAEWSEFVAAVRAGEFDLGSA